uniref:Uncharacterized protein n=1 Tax=Avena sativa TaxID=4498 RepID=A0ACD5VMZ0_AVESA
MMQGASAEGWNWVSPSPMDESSAKKARLELPNGHVKQELVVEQEAGAGVEGGVAAEYGSREDLAVRIDRRVLHCPLCSHPYKPHVFKCKGGHFACAACVAELPGGQCEACGNGGRGFDPCPELDAVVSSTRIACPHAGCGRFVVYHEAEEHQNACAHAPCHCTEPGCVGFAPGTAAALAGHLAAVHPVPVHTVKYGKVSPLLQVPASVLRLLLVAEDDGRVFLLTVGALGAAAAAVSVVCVRASAAARPRFTCKMWVNQVPPPPAVGAKSDVVLVEMQMRSSTSPGAVVPADEPTFLAVPRMYMVPGPGVVPAMEVALSVRIDKVSPRRADHLAVLETSS